MAKRKWYVVTVGRAIGVFSTWIEVAPLVKGVPNAIHQSFETRAEATRMFTEEQARGRARIVDPDSDFQVLPNPPQRARNYSAPSPFSTPAMPTFSQMPTPMHQGRHHGSPPLSVHPTTTSSRNRTSASSTPAPVVMSGTSNSSPATFSRNPRSALDRSPRLRRFQEIQAALEQESAARSQGQVRTPSLLSNTRASNSQSLTPMPGPSWSRPLQRAETAPDISRSPRTYHPLPASATRNRESAVGFDARASPVYHSARHPSHTNTYAYTPPSNRHTGGARTSNPTAKSTSEPASPSRGLQRTPPDTFRSHSSLATFGDIPARSSASPRAIVRTPEWLPSYPTSRTPSPDSDSDSWARTRPPSPGPSDELLSPLSNVNLNSFALDNHPPRGVTNTAERNTPTSVNPSTRPSPSGLNTQSQSPHAFANGIPQASFTNTSTPTSDRSRSVQQQGGPHRIEITHDSDPRSPILSPHQIPPLSSLEFSFTRPSPRTNSRPLNSSPLSKFSVNGHGPGLLFRH